MVACFYGFGLPLIPITVLLILGTTYIFEKIMVYIHYRKPPLYDETLNKTSVFILKWGAFLYVAIAYWILTNKQMFDNILNPIAYKDEIEDYHHHILEVPDKIHQRILLFYAISLFIFLLSFDICSAPFGKLFNLNSKRIVKEKEGLSTFSTSLKKSDKLHLMHEEKVRREQHGYKVLTDDFYTDLQELTPTKNDLKIRKQLSENNPNIKYITDSISYDPLDSTEEALKFSYVPAYKRRVGHDSINIDSEFTRLVFEYPYHKDLDLLKKISKKEYEDAPKI